MSKGPEVCRKTTRTTNYGSPITLTCGRNAGHDDRCWDPHLCVTFEPGDQEGTTP